ncbi:hypothetical protein [Halobacillus sp. H74]|uniref:hypothetical protein n=1 Tax=Halobacillus sp. H74 TaxID=3457436 RepID=UPI003FCCE7FD
MYLFFSIILSVLLGWLLMMAGPLLGGIIAFGIVAGCLFRGVYLLNKLVVELVGNSGAIAKQMPDKFSADMRPMPDPDRGGKANSNSLNTWAWVGFVILAVGGGFVLYRNKSSVN